VLATTRRADRLDALAELGVDHPLVDDGKLATQVRAIVPDGVDAALELVGTPPLPDTLRAVRVHGTVCFSGLLSNAWIVPDFYPIGFLPSGVRLTADGGDASDLPADARRHPPRARRHGARPGDREDRRQGVRPGLSTVRPWLAAAVANRSS
jgi:NADPH:quinone reductase-like Zn-dependent oxidoreductase